MLLFFKFSELINFYSSSLNLQFQNSLHNFKTISASPLIFLRLTLTLYFLLLLIKNLYWWNLDLLILLIAGLFNSITIKSGFNICVFNSNVATDYFAYIAI